MTIQQILSTLPYTKPFLFVGTLDEVNDNSARGTYTYKESEFYYEGHFKGNPVTPGVILTETMAQIGVVCLGIYLLRDKIAEGGLPRIAMVANEVNFLLHVYPGETVTVVSEKVFFRFGKLKCNVVMTNAKGEPVSRGIISGMVIR